MHPLRGRSLSFGSDKVSIPEMLVFVCGLPSNLTDELPQRVCKPCINKLESAYSICRDFKEKETILDRFYLNGFVLQRLVQYEKFRFDSDDNENEAPAAEENQANESNCEVENNESNTMEIKDVFSMNVSQSGMEEEEFSNSQLVQTVDDLSDDQPQQNMERYSQNSFVSLDTDYDSDDSVGFRPRKLLSTLKFGQRPPKPTLNVPLNPSQDGLFHCIHCPRQFSQRKHYMEHLSGHRALMEERYKCPNPDCGRCFRKRDQLNRHTINCCRRRPETIGT